MKKLYLIILLISSLNTVGQNYKFTMIWDPLQQVGGYYKLLTTGNYQIDFYNQNYNGQIKYKDYELKLDPNDYLRYELETATNGCANDPYDQPLNYFIKDLMAGLNSNRENCGGVGEIFNFKPSEIVLNSPMILENRQGNPPHYTICSGEQLSIYATILNKPTVLPKNYYPPQAFHWQYSVDNKKTWINVPDKIVQEGILKSNPDYNTPALITNTMEQIIGVNYQSYYNKIIFFRLGNSNISFADLDYGVLYSPCAPVVTGIDSPLLVCNGDRIQQIKVTFDRPLKTINGNNEVLKSFSLRDVADPTRPLFQFKTDVKYEGNTVSIPKTDLDNLTLLNGHRYFIEYQAWVGPYNKGVQRSRSEFDLKYNEPLPVTFSIPVDKIVKPLCNQGSDGSIVLYNVTGGTRKTSGLKYNYYVNGNLTNNVTENISNNIITTTIKGLSASLNGYKIKVIDSFGCYAEELSGKISEPTPITISGTEVPANEHNTNTGSITNLVINGGTGPYTTTIAGKVVDIEGGLVSGLQAGTYTITVRDANNCTVSRNFTIGQPARPFVVNIDAISQILCNGSATGKLKANATGGYQQYQYQWHKGNFLIGTSDTIENLTFGEYTLTVKDNNGTGIIKKASYNLIDAPKLNCTVTARSEKCHNTPTGSVILQPIGGTAPYTYQFYDIFGEILDGKSGSIAKSKDIVEINGFIAGDYNVIITDSNNCIWNNQNQFPNPVKIKVDQIDPLTVTLKSKTEPTPASGNDGKIEMTIAGGALNYSFSWIKNGQPFASNSNVLTGLSNGNYQVIVTDANNCSKTSEEITLKSLSVNLINITSISCNGVNNGSITIQVSGGTIDQNYKYKWSKNNIEIATDTPTITDLAPGEYKVIVSDKLTNIEKTYTINETPILEVKEDILLRQNVTCNGGDDGKIEIIVSGGTPGYNYKWNDGSTSKNRSGLKAGTYSVTVTDANECPKVLSNIIITAPTKITIPAPSIKNVSIYGESTGNIIFPSNPSGGNGNYTYQWSSSINGFSADTRDLTNLKAATYILKILDSKSCESSSYSFIVEENPKLSVIIKETASIKCNGNSDGELTADATGGFGSYKYIWKKNGTVILGENSSKLSNVGSGNYSVMVTDSANPQPSGPFAEAEQLGFNLIEPNKLLVTLATQTNVLCYGNNTGTIDINVNGGTLPYTYTWKKDDQQTVYATTEDLINLTSGLYSIVIIDKNNCETSLENILITQPTAPLVITDVEVKNLSGFETKNGSIEVSITGGSPDYIYSWRVKGSPAIIGNQSLLDELTTGTYELTVTDNNNCSIVKEYTLIQPEKLVITEIIQTENVKCFDNIQGVLEATISGGGPIGTLDSNKNYLYKWYNQLTPNLTASVTNPSEALHAGTYLLEVSDGFGNSFTSNPIVISQPDLLKINYTPTHVSCKNGQDGAINIAVTGGVAPYSIVWSTGENTDETAISGLRASTYYVTVTDANLCTTSEEITITEPGLLYLSQIIKTAPSALDADDASIAVTVEGGTPNYNFQWYDKDMNLIFTDNNKASNTSIYNIYAGQYFISVTDAKGCNIIKRDLDQVDPLIIEVNQINIVKCHGAATASIKASTTGGLPLYFYKWYEINDPSIIVGEAETLLNVKAGTYYVIATDSFGKSIQSQNILITEPSTLDNFLSSEYVRCGDGKDWTITSSPTGGTLPYSYLWNTGAKTANLPDTAPGNYSLLITDKNGCTITRTITLTAPIHLAAAEKIVIPTCYGGSDATIEVTASGGKVPYTYLWNTGEKSNILRNASAGVYSVAITDSKGCIINHDYTIVNPPKDVINLGEDVTLCFGQSITINASIDDDKATYLWKSDKGFSSNKAMITISEPANYTIVVTNKLGCEATDTIKVSSQNTAISAEFAISSQVFKNEKIVIVDISNPIADEIEWILPANTNIVSKDNDYAEISFSEIGQYEITLKTKKGDCTAFQTKQILVTEGEYEENNPDENDPEKKFDLKIYPNPSKGIFTVDIFMDQVMPAHVKVYNLNNNLLIDSKSQNGRDNYLFEFSLSGLPAGLYFVLFESQQGSKLRKIIIQ